MITLIFGILWICFIPCAAFFCLYMDMTGKKRSRATRRNRFLLRVGVKTA